MSEKETLVTNWRFATANTQVDAKDVRHYAFYRGNGATVTMTRASFTPVIPNDISEIPFIEVFIGGYEAYSPGDVTGYHGLRIFPGGTFNGTQISEGVYSGVYINDTFSVYGQNNGTSTWVFVAILKK